MKRSVVLFAAMFLAASPAGAGQASWGLPYGIIASEGNVVLFYTNGARTDPPTCPYPLQTQRFAIPATTDAGKAMISVLLTAHARGKRVFVNGTGNCNTWGDSEGVNFLQVED